MPKRKLCEITSPDTESLNLHPGTSRENHAADTKNLDTVSGQSTTASGDSESDTLTLAQQDRENQGTWECEYSYGGEADLHQHYDSCKKNPGHKNFIPVDKFSIKDLPNGYRNKGVVNYIRAVSDLTVRVTVQYVSEKRPANIPDSDKPYPGSRVRGQRRVTVGTGSVRHVAFRRNGGTWGPCKCKDCRNSSTPETNFAEISIVTATHVVFDNQEVEHTTCHLFFDRGGTPETCSGVVTLIGAYCMSCDVSTDDCQIECHTHDFDLARRLQLIIEQERELELTFRKKRPVVKVINQRPDVLDKQPMFFIVSHPHGCSKQISIGHWEKAYMFYNKIVSLMYTTETCPGSSGARVCDLQNSPVCKMYRDYLPAPHCGTSDLQPGYNYCTIDRESITDQIGFMEMPKPYGGPWDRCLEEKNQNQLYAVCKKYPRDGNFFPVEKFSMDNLPPFYRSDDVMELIKLVSDLTVRVSVYLHNKRIKFDPTSEVPYPYFHVRGSNLSKVGTGLIREIYKYSENCNCKECRHSTQPKTSFACIELRTAAHLVYDELDAAHTTCHLFFDSGETPDVCRNVVTLTDVKDCNFDRRNDYCTFQYITHDLDLADRLRRMTDKYKNYLYLLKKNGVNPIKENSREDTIEDAPLLIVVAHPHGGAKQIGIRYFPYKSDTKCHSSISDKESECGSSDKERECSISDKEWQCGSISHTEVTPFSQYSFLYSPPRPPPICSGTGGAPIIDLSLRLVYPVISKTSSINKF